jgi:hypothetical protein
MTTATNVREEGSDDGNRPKGWQGREPMVRLIFPLYLFY